MGAGSMIAVAAGVLMIHPSPALPASNKQTLLSGFSESRLAMTQPAEPPPTTT
jgi:hypothetical protein